MAGSVIIIPRGRGTSRAVNDIEFLYAASGPRVCNVDCARLTRKSLAKGWKRPRGEVEDHGQGACTGDDGARK